MTNHSWTKELLQEIANDSVQAKGIEGDVCWGHSKKRRPLKKMASLGCVRCLGRPWQPSPYKLKHEARREIREFKEEPSLVPD